MKLFMLDIELEEKVLGGPNDNFSKTLEGEHNLIWN